MSSIKKCDLLAGEYEVTTELKADAVYRWVKAVQCSNGHLCVLQILQLDLEQKSLDTLINYFQTLQTIDRKEILKPTQVLSDANHPLILVYLDISAIPFDLVIKSTSVEEALELWHQASERLHVLHNQNLVHGRVTWDTFVIANKAVYLTNFGYAPLLTIGHEVAFKECSQFLAPEVTAQHSITSAVDIYAFAKTVADWQPQLINTQWYSLATSPTPDNRYRRIRKLFETLKQALTSLFAPELQVNNTPTVEDNTSSPKGSLIPKFILNTNVEPKEAGKVEGGGSYFTDATVHLKAIPATGWQFHCWSEDKSGSQNPETIVINGNKTVIARFVKVKSQQTAFSTEIPNWVYKDKPQELPLNNPPNRVNIPKWAK